MRKYLRPRYLGYTTLSAFTAGALYIAACFHVLAKLSETSLVTHYISFPRSPTSPVYPFPLAGWVTDWHWKTSGLQRVLDANQHTNDFITYLPERVALAKQLAEPIDVDRAQRLLTELVCAKRSEFQAMDEINAYQKKWPSALLEAAIKQCS